MPHHLGGHQCHGETHAFHPHAVLTLEPFSKPNRMSFAREHGQTGKVAVVQPEASLASPAGPQHPNRGRKGPAVVANRNLSDDPFHIPKTFHVVPIVPIK